MSAQQGQAVGHAQMMAAALHNANHASSITRFVTQSAPKTTGAPEAGSDAGDVPSVSLTFLPTNWLARATALALFGVVVPALAWGAPPPMGSDDYNVMMPYKDWVTSQHDNIGRWCCDISDGRPVEARINGDHWEAHITSQHFPGEDDKWVEVPKEKVLHQGNPMGTPIIWLYQGRVQCFAPPDGV